MPGEVLLDRTLSDKSKLLYAVIIGLTHNSEHECFASNKYFCDIFDVNTDTIQKCLRQLEDAGYIERRVVYKEGTKEIEKRYIKVILQVGAKATL